MADAISAGTAAAVSDGSFDATLQRGTSAFILAPSSNSPLCDCIMGGNCTTGIDDKQSAYRSELAGALAVLSTVDLLVSHFGISSGAVTIAFDGKAALDAASSPSGCRTLSVSQPCFDYLQVIHNRLASLPITVHWQWVHGHQRERGITDVDWWGEMNNVADTLAKELLSLVSRYLTGCTTISYTTT